MSKKIAILVFIQGFQSLSAINNQGDKQIKDLQSLDSEEQLLQTQIMQFGSGVSHHFKKINGLAQTESKIKALQSAPEYNSKQVRGIIENLEFLTHKTTAEARQQLNEPGTFHEARLEKMTNLVTIANANLAQTTQISIEGLIENPKLVSFNLMKLDMEQSCRSQCEIVKGSAEAGSNVHVIANSTDQLHVQQLQQQKTSKSNLKKSKTLHLNQKQSQSLAQMHKPSNEMFLGEDSEMNLYEQSNQRVMSEAEFDFLKQFKNLGNSILSLFGQQDQQVPNEGDEQEEDDEIQIEEQSTPLKGQQAQALPQTGQSGASVNRILSKQDKKNQNDPEYMKKVKELKDKLVRPMGNEAEIEENLLEETEQMNTVMNGDIIQPQFAESKSQDKFQIHIQVQNKTNGTKNITQMQQPQSKASKILFYEIKESCPFSKCNLLDMKGKKWASVEDAGILLCTKAPESVDCLKYNTEYRKLLKLKRDLQYEGVNVEF